MKVYIGTHRRVGQECIEWAKINLPVGVELVDTFEECDIFISVLYDRLISESEIRSKHKCFNFHPGILPQHRGSGSYSWVIINNETRAGVTLHEIDQSIDHGPIIDVMDWKVSPDDTAESLFNRAEKEIRRAFVYWFEKLVNNDYDSVEQNESVARLYYRKELEKARDLTRFVRAFTFEGKPNAYFINKKGERVELEY